MTGRSRALSFADGTAWTIRAEGTYASSVLDLAAEVAALASPGGGEPAARQLLLADRDDPHPRGAEDELILLEPGDADTLSFDAMKVLLVMARRSIERGGLLLHSGLAERDGSGVLLGGRSKAGKSTAARRLPDPWRALCDDITLVVPGEKGGWYGHPLPTWSRISAGSSRQRWRTGEAVPLRGAFLLEQSVEDRALPVGRGEGLCLLHEICDQAVWPMTQVMGETERRIFRLGLFDNLARFTASVPVFRLRLTLHGSFWCQLERAALAEACPAGVAS